MADVLDFFSERATETGLVWDTTSSIESLAYVAEQAGSEIALRPTKAVSDGNALTHVRQGSWRVTLDDPDGSAVRIVPNSPYAPTVFYTSRSPVRFKGTRVGEIRIAVRGAYVYQGVAECGSVAVTELFRQLATLESSPFRVTIARLLRESFAHDPEYHVSTRSTLDAVRNRVAEDLIELIISQHFSSVGSARVSLRDGMPATHYSAPCDVTEETEQDRIWELRI